jgi:pyruvate formate lyase activating enzyme
MHFTAFHPSWKMRDRRHTPIATLSRARAIARSNGVRHAYTGNVHDPAGTSTYCHGCGELLIEREGYRLGYWGLDQFGNCEGCGATPAGHFSATPDSFGARRVPVRLSV